MLSDRQIRALFAACAGPHFEDIRDTAIARLLFDTGMRRDELSKLRASLTDEGRVIGDLNLTNRSAIVIGKGTRPREIHFGARTARAVRAYLEARYAHPDAHLPGLWLGRRGPLSANGILLAMRRRGRKAGIPGLFIHQFRHTFASNYLSAGGQEGDLMRLTGWRTRDMLDRYGASARDTRAADAYRRMGAPGDRL